MVHLPSFADAQPRSTPSLFAAADGFSLPDLLVVVVVTHDLLPALHPLSFMCVVLLVVCQTLLSPPRCISSALVPDFPTLRYPTSTSAKYGSVSHIPIASSPLSCPPTAPLTLLSHTSIIKHALL